MSGPRSCVALTLAVLHQLTRSSVSDEVPTFFQSHGHRKFLSRHTRCGNGTTPGSQQEQLPVHCRTGLAGKRPQFLAGPMPQLLLTKSMQSLSSRNLSPVGSMLRDRCKLQTALTPRHNPNPAPPTLRTEAGDRGTLCVPSSKNCDELNADHHPDFSD